MISNQLSQTINNSPAIAPYNGVNPTEETAPIDYQFLTRRLSMTQVAGRFLNAKPVVRHKGEYFKIKDLPVEILGNHAFNWFKKNDPTCRVEREDTPCQLKVLQQKKTYHKSTELFFKPDVEEVLNQIPEELLGKKIYFSTAPFGDGTVRYQDVHALDKGYATGCTTFYEECESESSQCNIL